MRERRDVIFTLDCYSSEEHGRKKMTELVTTGTWSVCPAKEVEFIQAWSAFAAWASSMPGAGTLRLGRDTGDSTRYVSFGAWQDEPAIRAWKSQPEFRERLAQVLQYVDEFRPYELDVIAISDHSTIAQMPDNAIGSMVV